MKYLYLMSIGLLSFLMFGCGTKIVIESPKNSFIYVQQSSDQKTTNDIPIDIPIDGVLGKMPELGGLLGKIKPDVESPVLDIKPDIKPEEPTADVPTGQRFTLRSDTIGGKNWTWLPMSGVSIGRSIVFTFPECGTRLEVVDPTKAWGADGNAENYNQSYYFSGNPDLQDDFNMSCAGGCASIFAPPNCTAAYGLMEDM